MSTHHPPQFAVPLITSDRPDGGGHGGEVELGSVVYATAISAANILKDLREHITNTFGGRMSKYEELVEETTQRALMRLAESAQAQGYHGVCAMRLSNPTVVEGGVEVIAYGTGFRKI